MVAASSRKGIHMTGNFEHTKRTSDSAASSRAEGSCVSLRSSFPLHSLRECNRAQELAQPGLVQAEDIITPEELAARLKVPESWVYEKTRGRCRNPIPCLRLGRYVRFDWTAVATWLSAPAPQDSRSAKPVVANRPDRATRPNSPRPA
jgi:excisionase family DNA binding protein